MNKNFSIRDKSILIGLYLSRFDDLALSALGFEGTIQAFNTLGYSIGSKPASIKNYRDEFDPYFPNPRKGWHKRGIRQYCKQFLDDFKNVSFADFTELIKEFVIKDYTIEKLINNVEKKDYSDSIAKRLITGAAAEEYFKTKFHTINAFSKYDLVDTTKLACGFDFHLKLGLDYYCVEVKGLNTSSGNIGMTEKEFLMAQSLKERYCLFVVSNFIETPVHQFFFDPSNSNLIFKKTERPIIQTTYNTQI